MFASITKSLALVDHPRNVPEDILRRLAVNGGAVMVNLRCGWSDADIVKLAGGNLLRAMGAVEQVALSLQARYGVAKP